MINNKFSIAISYQIVELVNVFNLKWEFTA